MIKKQIIFFIAAIFLLYGCNGISKKNEGTSFVKTDNYANKQLEYYYYIPHSIKKQNNKLPFLILIPGSDSKGESMVTSEVKNFAEKENFIIVAPTFINDGGENDENYRKEICYHFPAAWSGKALLSITEKLRPKGGDPENLYLFGFSAGAQFAGRFALIHDDKVKAAFIYAAGGPIETKRKLKTKFYIAIGRKDTDSRKYFAAKLAKSLVANHCDVDGQMYNLGHELSRQVYDDALDFIKNAK